MRVVVVGHGLIGKQRARALVALAEQGVSLAATVDPAARPADLYGAVPHFAKLADVPRDAYDAAVIAVPHHLAKDIALTILEQRKPILLEKPLGLDVEQAKVIASAAGAGPLPSFVGYNYRFLPTMRAVFQRAAEGFFGEMRSVELLLGHGGHPRSAQEWKLSPEAAGGGVLIDPGVHLLDLLLCVLPRAKCHSVVSTLGFWKTGIEEDVAATFTDARAIATVRVSLVRWINTFRLEFVGEDGYALIEGRGGNYGAQTIRFGKRWGWNDGSGRSQRETEEVIDFGKANVSLDDELAAVVAIWQGRQQPTTHPHPATMAEATAVAALCDDMYARMKV